MDIFRQQNEFITQLALWLNICICIWQTCFATWWWPRGGIFEPASYWLRLAESAVHQDIWIKLSSEDQKAQLAISLSVKLYHYSSAYMSRASRVCHSHCTKRVEALLTECTVWTAYTTSCVFSFVLPSFNFLCWSSYCSRLPKSITISAFFTSVRITYVSLRQIPNLFVLLANLKQLGCMPSGFVIQDSQLVACLVQRTASMPLCLINVINSNNQLFSIETK